MLSRQLFTNEPKSANIKSPEVIIGKTYNKTAEIRKFAYMMFELATGDVLFEPRAGQDFTKDDDHLVWVVELLGAFPRHFSSY